jgi:hypothetical protein
MAGTSFSSFLGLIPEALLHVRGMRDYREKHASVRTPTTLLPVPNGSPATGTRLTQLEALRSYGFNSGDTELCVFFADLPCVSISRGRKGRLGLVGILKL